MIQDLGIFVLGVVVLFASGDFLVRASIALSLKMAISPLVIGLTVVAFGTSAPELLVAVQASVAGFGGLALGNIVGSNIANIFLILGVPALIIKISNTDQGLARNYYFLLASTILFITFLLTGGIRPLQGFILIVSLFLFLGITLIYRSSSQNEIIDDSFEDQNPQLNRVQIVVYCLIGIFGLPIGAKILVFSATNFAQALGISEEVIGLSLVAVGTSLPELTTSIVSAYRRQMKLLLGNVIGSNLFNILGIAGTSAIISKLSIGGGLTLTSLFLLFFSTAALVPFVFFRLPINRLVGIGFLFIYIWYIVTLV